MNNIGYKDDKIFLLSEEEYEMHMSEIPHITCFWWLRSPGRCSSGAACVLSDGSVSYYGGSVNYGRGAVRPALKFGNLQISKSKKGQDYFIFGEARWKIIDDGKKIAISEMPLWFGAFDSKSNNYGTSEVRKKLLEWMEEAENEAN